MSVEQPLICCPAPREPLYPCHRLKVWFASCSGEYRALLSSISPSSVLCMPTVGGSLEFSIFTRFCTRCIVQPCWVPPASPPGKGYQEADRAPKRSLSKWPRFRQVLEMQAWIFPMGHLEGKELMAGGGRRMVSCPYPAQTNTPQGSSCLEQARNTVTNSFTQVFLWYLPLTGALGVWK